MRTIPGNPSSVSPSVTVTNLTAPEAYIVLNGLDADPSRALKLALTQLIASCHLRVISALDPRIVVVSGRQGELPPTLHAVWRALAWRARKQPNGLPLSGLGRLAREQWGEGAINYVRGDILPALRTLGLYAEERYRFLRIFPRQRTVLTEAGRAAQGELQRLERMARGGPRRWERDVAGGVAGFMALAGASIFLFDQNGGFLKNLMLAEQAKAGAHLWDAKLPVGEGLEAIDGLLSIDWGNLAILDALDTFVDSLDTFDSSIDSGGGDFSGDSGSDSGGGDGGGGGE